MMTSQELRTSPLFENISYEDYRRMLTCFQAVQRSFLPEEMIYDFAGSRRTPLVSWSAAARP